MKIISSEQNVMWDIDDTLVITETSGPYDLILFNPNKECNEGLMIHHEHVKQLKSHKNRGFNNIVWSGNGYSWAKIVIDALGLNEYVDLIMTKPQKFFDDLPAEQVLVNRVYIPFKEKQNE